MRLAIIDHSYNEPDSRAVLDGIRVLLNEKGIQTDIATGLKEFERIHVNLSMYEGLLLHPGLEGSRESIEEIREKYPSLKIALASAAPEDYSSCAASILNYRNYRLIRRFFGFAEQSAS